MQFGTNVHYWDNDLYIYLIIGHDLFLEKHYGNGDTSEAVIYGLTNEKEYNCDEKETTSSTANLQAWVT